jgi:glycosyltransferase involved in cell wall biosynthesis
MRKISLLCCLDSAEEEAGTERYVSEIIRRLDKTRFDVHLCCFQDSARLRELTPFCSIRVLPLVKVFQPHGLRQIRSLRSYINDQEIDIVHTFTPKATIVGVLAAKTSEAKVIIASRRNLGYWYTPWTLRLFRYLNRHTTRLLANSEAVKRRIIAVERAATDKIDVLRNGVDTRRYMAGRDLSSSSATPMFSHSPLVGIVANYRPVKDLPLFLRAARLVADAVPTVAFLLVGRGPLRSELAQLAAELGIADRVCFSDGAGAVPDYLPRFKVACLSSHSEGFSNAILEYMAAGLPVVATDVGGNGEAIQDGVTGYLVRARTPQAFAEPIIRLLRDESLRTAMARASYQRCCEKFEIGNATRQLEAYYRRLIDE